VFGEDSGGKLALTVSILVGSVLLAQPPSAQTSLDQASTAYRQGKTAEAAQILEAILKNHPSEPGALVLMGVVLDAQQRYVDAETYYQRVLKVAPGAPQVLNNAANHFLAAGNRNRARELYLKTIAIESGHVNANLQLAQMSVDDKQGRQALAYLNRITDTTISDPGALLLRARALALSERCAEAGAVLKKVEDLPGGDPSLYFSVGMAQAECKHYDAAEASFSRALDADPRNVEILYNLGLAALRADHPDRARSVLEIALKERPDDADALYALAQVCLKQQRRVEAAALLTKAETVAPARADIILLIAQVAAQVEFYEDSAAAYDRYLKLIPEDDAARRERGFDLARANDSKSALRDLEWYVGRHPRDGIGYFELAVAQMFANPAKALQSLDKAIGLDSALYQARYTRAVLNLQEGNPAAAIADLQVFLKKEPEHYRALAHLGQAYFTIGRLNDAAEVLERARTLAPDSRLVLVRYRRVMEALGRHQEAAAALARLTETGNNSENVNRRVGLIDYLSLPTAGQRARYLSNLREQCAADPRNVHLKIRLARELLAQGQTGEALESLRQLTPAALDASLLADCGRMLLEFNQFELARQFLEPALAKAPSDGAARLDLAIAIYRLQTPAAALLELDKTSPGDRQGDYYLLRAQLLDALDKFPEAADALNHGIQTAPTRPELYLQAAGFLLKHKRYDQALRLLEQASGILPDNRDLLLAQAVTLAIIPRDEEAQKILAKIQARWPEWDRPYLLNGIILEIQLRSAEAKQMLETAIALGADTPEAYYYETLAITHTTPDDLALAQSTIARALTLTSNDPYIFLLAGKLSIARKQYPAAIEQLVRATNLLPTLIPAHYALRDAYKAVGDERKSAAEVQAIERIADKNAASDRSPFPVENFVFTVRPPG
jgi:tetratricopeptide (TPR) repeat protein